MPEISASRYVTSAGWDDVPHLDEKTKSDLLASTPPFLRDARARGIPSMGAGAIYPVAWEDVSCEPFKPPSHWRRAYALDVGWNRTAALWGAWDETADIIYAYAEHYLGQQVPAVHGEAIKARGAWIKGVIDPAARGRTAVDGERMIETYKALGLHLTPADNSVTAGIEAVWQRLLTGRLKFFTSLGNLHREYRVYRRDEKGNIIKKNDHLMDALRYLVMSGGKVASTQKPENAGAVEGWRVLDEIAGY